MISDQSTEHFSEKIALVTGASKGIGYEIAVQLAEAGAHVIALASSRASLNKLAVSLARFSPRVSLVGLELENAQKLKSLAQDIYYKFGKINFLIGNAATLGVLGPVEKLDPLLVEKVFKINTLANWYLINSFAPLLYEAPKARAVFITSSVAESARAFWSAYAASKAALELLVKCWAKENAHRDLKINLLDPGATRTGMRAAAFPNENPNKCIHPSKIATEVLRLLRSDCDISGKCWVVKTQSWRS